MKLQSSAYVSSSQLPLIQEEAAENASTNSLKTPTEDPLVENIQVKKSSRSSLGSKRNSPGSKRTSLSSRRTSLGSRRTSLSSRRTSTLRRTNSTVTESKLVKPSVTKKN